MTGHTGKVHPGGPAQARELARLSLCKFLGRRPRHNSYLLRCRESGEQILVDAAAEPDRLLALVGDDGLAGVVTSHRHADHWQALAEGRDGRAHLRPR